MIYRIVHLLNFVFFTHIAFSQLTCGTTVSSLSNAQLGDVSSNVSSYTYSASTYSMPFNVFVAKTSGNGPNFYPYGANSLWVGKDNGIDLDSVVVEITFSGEVLGVILDFEKINNNSVGEEQIQRIYPKLANGQLLTTGVSYVYQPGVPSGSTAGSYFVNGTKTIKAYSGFSSGQNGRLIISSNTPFKKIRFTQREITSAGVAGPNGILVSKISYCPVIPDIAVSKSMVNLPTNTTVSYGTTGYGNPVSQVIQISNQGTGNLTLSSLQLQNNTNWQMMNNVQSVIVPDDTVFLTVQFNPLISGSLTDQLQIVSNDWDESNYTVKFTGTGKTAHLTASDQGSIIPDGGSIQTNSTYVGLSSLDSVLLQNTGIDTLMINSISLSNNAFSSSNNGNLTLAPGASTWYVYQFTPISVGNNTTILTAVSNDPTSPFVFTINGNGISPATIMLTACENQLPYIYHGNSYLSAGNYNEVVMGVNGQDSLTILTLSTLAIDSTQSSYVFCNTGFGYQWNGQLLQNSGMYQATLTAANGCDSVATLNFTVQNNVQNTVSVMVCPEAFPYNYSGQTISAAGNYVIHNYGPNGCDSMVNYNVSTLQSPSSSQSISICQSAFPYLWNGISIVLPGTYSHTTSSVITGCDSLVNLTLSTLPNDSVFQNQTVNSAALPFLWNGMSLSQSGNYSVQLQNTMGCDSIVWINLVVLPPPVINLTVLYEGVLETNPGNHTLPNIPISSSIIQTITLVNNGTQNLAVSSINLSGGEAVLMNSNISNIPGGGSATFQIKFQPATIGPKQNSITINSNDPSQPQFVINCNYNAINGVYPDIRCFYNNTNLINGNILFLSNVNIPVGVPYSFLFEVKNIGQSNLQIGNITCSNGLVNPNYNHQMVANSSQFISAIFNPSLPGLQFFNILVPSNDANEPSFLIPVRVDVYNPVIPEPEIEVYQNGANVLTQSSLNFPSTTVGQFSSMTLSIKNIGTTDLILQPAQFSSNNFSMVGSLPSHLPPGQSYSVILHFTPTQAGNISGNLTLYNDDSDENPFVLLLTGSALLPSLANCNACNALIVNSNPINKAEWVDVKPVFEWQHEEGSGITSYKVQVFTANGTGLTPVLINGSYINSVNAPTTSVNARLIMNNSLTYYTDFSWTVTAYSSAGLPISCFKRTFKTIPKPQPKPFTCMTPPGVSEFGTKLGVINNVPVYKNGGCQNGTYETHSWLIASQSNWSYGWQCVELPSRYYKTRYLINCSKGNGKDYFDVTNNRKGFRQLVNILTTSAPKPDDFMSSMKASDPGSAGHVVMIKTFTPNYNINQNDYTLKIYQENAGTNNAFHLNDNLSLKSANGKWKVIPSSSANVIRGWVRAKPEILGPGTNNSIPVIQTTTPSFTWAKHNNIKGYKVKLYRLIGSCYHQVSSTIQISGNQFNGQGFPALIPGSTYKWFVENIFYNTFPTYFAGSTIPASAYKSVLSDNYYFKVASTAVATNSQGTVSASGGNLSQIFVQTIASAVNGSNIYYKSDEDWAYLDATRGPGTADMSYEFESHAGDSMFIERRGYLPIKIQLTERMLKEKLLVPMLAKTDPIVFKVNHLPVKDLSKAAMKICGSQFNGFKIATEGVFEEVEYSAKDTILNLPLTPGMNYFEFMVYNDFDTIFISDKWLIVDTNMTSFKVFYHARNQAKYDVYVDGDLMEQGKSNGVITLPEGSYDLTFHAFGYAPVRFNIWSDTLLTLLPEKSEREGIDTMVFANGLGHYVGGNVSVDPKNNSFIQINKFAAESDVKHEPWSETLKIKNNSNQYTAAWILNYPVIPDYFLVKIVSNEKTVYLSENQFGDSISFDRTNQIVKLINFTDPVSVTLVNALGGVDEPLDRDFVVFPNPSSDPEVFVYLEGMKSGQQIQLFNLEGRSVGTAILEGNGRDVSVVDISYLSKGVYYFVVVVGDTRKVCSFMKI